MLASYWAKIIFCAQTQTSIRMSRGISSLRGASQGLSRSFFHHRFTWPNWLLQGLWGCHLSWDLSDLLWSLAQRSHKILKVRSALLRSGSLLWLVYVFNRSFQQTFVGEGLRDKPKEPKSQKNVFVTCVWKATKFSPFGWSLRLYFLLFLWFTVLISILLKSYFIASRIA